MKIGANLKDKGKYEFIVWAPLLKEVTLKVVYPKQSLIPMKKDDKGYWRVVVDDIYPQTRYCYKLEGPLERPDPASYFQPEGVYGPSEIIDHDSFPWEDEGWRGVPLEKMVIYELHVGTFTQDGIFEAVIQKLEDLKNLGINAIELMPVAQFPGERNWGYDAVYPFALQNSYGGPKGLKKLVNASHNEGLAVILDVVYNHLGPEGNYFLDFGPYFTDRYKTPWGDAINFDGEYSEGVRNFFIENALYWFHHYHIDALRLDAIHGIYDTSTKHILEELAEKTKEFSEEQGREFYLIAESDLNEANVVRQKELGGYGIDAQWLDDFHHCLHTTLTQERTGYYQDFRGVEDLIKSMRNGFVCDGRFSIFRNRNHGSSSKGIPSKHFIVFSQNHDQVGNRLFGERLSVLVDFEALKVAVATVLCSPYIPLLFMGEEYGEESPFFYFVSHSDKNLIEAVRKGRKKEFQSFEWGKEPPDPQDINTFLSSKLKWQNRKQGKHKVLSDFYQQLISLRKEMPALANLDKHNMAVFCDEDKEVMVLSRWYEESRILCIINFNKSQTSLFIPQLFVSHQSPDVISSSLQKETGFINHSGIPWEKVIDSSDTKWMGPGSSAPTRIVQSQELILRPLNFVLYKKEIFE